MEQYISKSALLAEIEKLYDEEGAFYAADVFKLHLFYRQLFKGRRLRHGVLKVNVE